jgi:type I restriction enzyme S subunit
MSAFPKYPAYKDSGVEWLGEVPEHWGVYPNRRLFEEKKVPVGKRAHEYKLLSLTLNGVIPRDMENPKGKFPAEFNTYSEVEPDDLVFCLFDLDETPRTVGISPCAGMITGAYTILKPKREVNPKYQFYYYLSLDEKKALKPLYTGLRKTISRSSFASAKSPCPPRAEQDRIVAFLDEKTAQIDALIAKKQRQIELLDEQKTILINRAVTRGLQPNPDLQDSGIPWIGPIPKGWEVKSAKHACERIIDCKNRTAEVVTNGNYYVLRTSNVKKGELVRDEITRTNLKNFTIWTERGAPQAGDVLFTREAPAGEACVFDGSLPACLGQRMMYFRPDTSQLLPQFLVHTIYFGPSATYIQLKTNGSTVGHLRLPDVYALPVLLPPVDEQKRILEALAATDESQKKLIQTMESQIQTLQTLRSTLIAHAVTGKIKVS